MLETLLPSRIPQFLAKTIPLEELPMELDAQMPEAAFVRSVERYGVLQPIVVTKQGEGWKILDGRRRVFAARQAGMQNIETRVEVVEDWKAVALLTLVSELRKSNLLAQTKAVEELLAIGGDEKTIQSASGLGKAKIKKLIGLVGLEERLKGAFYDEKIKGTVALAAAKQDEAVQALLGDDFERDGNLTPAHVKAVVAANQVAEMLGEEIDKQVAKASEGKSEETPDGRKATAAALGRQMLERLAGVDVDDKVRRHLEEVVAALEG